MGFEKLLLLVIKELKTEGGTGIDKPTMIMHDEHNKMPGGSTNQCKIGELSKFVSMNVAPHEQTKFITELGPAIMGALIVHSTTKEGEIIHATPDMAEKKFRTR